MRIPAWASYLYQISQTRGSQIRSRKNHPVCHFGRASAAGAGHEPVGQRHLCLRRLGLSESILSRLAKCPSLARLRGLREIRKSAGAARRMLGRRRWSFSFEFRESRRAAFPPCNSAAHPAQIHDSVSTLQGVRARFRCNGRRLEADELGCSFLRDRDWSFLPLEGSLRHGLRRRWNSIQYVANEQAPWSVSRCRTPREDGSLAPLGET